MKPKHLFTAFFFSLLLLLTALGALNAPPVLADGPPPPEPGQEWLLLPPAPPFSAETTPFTTTQWARVTPLFDELQSQNLLGNIRFLPGGRAARVTPLAEIARRRLEETGLVVLPATPQNLARAGLTPDDSACRPTPGRAPQNTGSVIVDTTQDYVEKYLESDTSMTVTLRASNNGIKEQEKVSAYSYGSNRRVCLNLNFAY